MNNVPENQNISKRVSYTFFLMSGFLIVLFMINIYSYRYFVKWHNTLADSSIQSYTSEYDAQFSVLKRSVLNSMLSDKNFINLSFSLEDPNSYEETSERLREMDEVRTSFSSLCRLYGTDYYFWYFCPSSETFVEYSEVEYSLKDKYHRYLTEQYDNHQLEELSRRKWFIADGAIMCVCSTGNRYGGIIIETAAFIRNMAQLRLSDNYAISLLNQDGKRIVTYNVDESGFRETDYAEHHTVSTFKASLENADMIIQYDLDLPGIKTASTAQVAIFLILMIVVVVSFFQYQKIQEKVVRPLDYFRQHITDYYYGYRFPENSGAGELDAMANLLNRLSEETESLKVEIYEEKLHRQSVELDFEQSRIRPHFFINCLNVIYSMSQIGRSREIQQMCLHTSSYLRYLFGKNTSLYPLKEELECIENYLEIMKEIYGQRFEYMCHVEKEMEKMRLPAIVLQTFVGNAVKHARTEQGNNSVLCISLTGSLVNERSGEIDMAEFKIADNGGGFPADILTELQSGYINRKDERHQIGILNVMQRLSLIYGDQADIHFKNSEYGAVVIIHIPVRKE